MVDNTFYRDFSYLFFRGFIWEVKMLKYFMKFRLGWFVLHIIAILLTFLLGYTIKF